MTAETTATGQSAPATRPVLAATGLVKSYGRVDALRGTDFELYPGEILAVIGDNGAGKSTLIRCLSGAETPDAGTITLDGAPVHFRDVQQAKQAGIETVYQSLAVSPALDIATNLYLGREIRKKGPLGSVFRMLDTATMRRMAREHVTKLGDRDASGHHPSGGDPVRRPAASRRSRAGRRLRQQGDHHGRANGRPRRAGVRPGGRPHQAPEGGRPPDCSHQPRHAQRLPTGRPHPRAASWPARGDHQAGHAHDGTSGGDHDRGRRRVIHQAF